MADESPTPGSGPFDVETVRRLVRLMSRFDVSEIDLHEGERRIRLRRGALSAAPAAVQAAPVYAAPPPAASAVPEVPAAPARKLLEIKSPMVGTFYAKPSPDKDDYVKVGSRVSPDTVVCQIEAMKIFNALPAGVTGTVAEVVAENGQFVEYDQVLFRVDPS